MLLCHLRVLWRCFSTIMLQELDALTAHLNADAILQQLNIYTTILHKDSSTIVRDYAIDCLGNAATANDQAAAKVLPVLKNAVEQWEDKHLSRILGAMARIAIASPVLAIEVLKYGEEYSNHAKGSVQKAAKKLVNAVNKKRK
jgi:hypothetical protein